MPPSGIYGRREQMIVGDFIVNRLEEALRDQGALTGERPEPTAFARLLVNHFVRFPAADIAAA